MLADLFHRSSSVRAPRVGRWLGALWLALFIFQSFAAETIPPVPPRYFNDFAGVVPQGTAQELNTRLEDFEKATSSQVVVAIYKKMESASSVQDYTVRVAQAWRVGQKDKRNGAVLFLFIENRTMFLQVGYGLEGAIPDAVAKQITEFEIKPHLKEGNYDAGLRAGVAAILKAAQGEYKGNGRTAASQRGNPVSIFQIIFAIFVLILIISSISRRRKRGGRVYDRGGWGSWGGGWGGGSSGGGGGWSGGDSGGGGFSSGGGDFGGGGAGSSW